MKAGEYYRPLSTFRVEDNTFKKGIDYQLVSIEMNEEFTLFVFIDDKQESLLFGDYEDNFNDRFKLSREERVKLINTILYED